MQTRLQIENGVVTNAIVVDPANVPAFCADWPVAPDGVGIGWSIDGEGFAPPPGPSLADWRATASLTRGAFVLACVEAGVLTEADGEAAALGEWPAGFNAFLAALPVADRISAKAAWADASRVRRVHPLIAQLAAAAQLTEAQVDALFGWTDPA